MLNHRKMVAPECTKCEKVMAWKSEQIVDEKQMQVFECKTCKKLQAVLLPPTVSSDQLAESA